MGQSQSASHTAPTRALHVLRVTPLSPASHTNIEPFFDFVVGYDGDSLAQNTVDVAELERIVEAHEGRTLNLMVWNSKNQETRVVSITPSRAWSQNPSQTADPQFQPSLLGLSMRICEPEFALDNVWHVLDVVEGSPAESAGLVPYGDYITGWSGGVLGAENDFYDLVEAHVDKPLRVYVYSHDFDALREVVLVPNRHWGGNGLLGCVFGYGLIHRIPPRSSTHATTTMSDIHEEYEDQDLFVPVDDPRYHNNPDWHSRGESSDILPLGRSAHGSNFVSTIPEEDNSSDDASHDHGHVHDHEHEHGHDHSHHGGHSHSHAHDTGHSHSPITPALTPSPSPSNRPSPRPFFTSGTINGAGTPKASFSSSSPLSTPVILHPTFSFASAGNEESSDDEGRGSLDEKASISHSDTGTSHGSLTSVD